MLGIENLKKVVVAAVHLANKIDEITQDGFQPLGDLVSLLPNLADSIGVIKNGRDAWKEFQDLDDAERDEVLAVVKEEFDIDDDQLEDIVESAFDTIDAVGDFIQKVRLALKK